MTSAQRRALLAQLELVIRELHRLRDAYGLHVIVDRRQGRRWRMPYAELTIRIPERVDDEPLAKYIPREGR